MRYELRRISPLPLGILFAALAVFGWLVGAALFLIFGMSMPGPMDHGPWAGEMLLTASLMQLAGGIVAGFLTGILAALVYNLVAGVVGGVVMEFRDAGSGAG